jgi:hypothetical protein
MVTQPYCITGLYETFHSVAADNLVARQFSLVTGYADLSYGGGGGRQLIIIKIGATVGVKPLKLFPLNKTALNISHICTVKSSYICLVARWIETENTEQSFRRVCKRLLELLP